MVEGARSDLELEQELDELYRNVSGQGTREGVAPARKERTPEMGSPAPRRRRGRRLLLAATVMLVAGATGLAFLAWRAGGDDETGPARTILDIAGLKRGRTVQLVDKDGRPMVVPPGAVILPLEADERPPAPPTVPPAPARPAWGGPLPGGEEPPTPEDLPLEPAATPAPPPAASSGGREVDAPASRQEGAYAVQIRAYPEDRRPEALAFAQELRRTEGLVTVETVTLPGRGVWHRVLIGSFATAEEAAEYRQERLAGRYPLSFVQRRTYFSQRAW